MDYSWYYNQVKDHYLEPLESGGQVKSFYLRQKPDRRLMSALLVFSPEGIIITGDLRPAANGVIALGYGLEWFGSKLDPDYLASKFLKEMWVKERFIEWIKEYIRQGIQDRSLDFERKTWRVGSNQIALPNYTEGRAWRYLISQHEDELDTAERAYNSIPAYLKDHRWYSPYDSSDFLGAGYGYAPCEVGWLYAIQRRFAELMQPQLKSNPIEEGANQ